MKHLVTAGALAAMFATGCMGERVYMDPQQNAGAGRGTNNLNLRDGTLRGDFGPRSGFDGPATDMTGASDPQYQSSTITVSRTERERGTGMVILWTNGVLLEALQEGTHEFANDPESMDQPTIAMNVCSGDDTANIDYDAPADRGTVTVARLPDGSRTFDVHTETMHPSTGVTDVADAQFTLTR